jgi:hypothetical protein
MRINCHGSISSVKMTPNSKLKSFMNANCTESLCLSNKNNLFHFSYTHMLFYTTCEKLDQQISATSSIWV